MVPIMIRCLPLFCLSILLYAQLTSTGAVQGIVVDSSGTALPSVNITLRQASSSATRQITSSDSGQFQVSGLQIGTYSLRCEKPGFNPVVFESIEISIGQTLTQRITMRPADVNESLEVHEEAEALQPTATNANVILGGERIEEAPAPSRNFLNFVLIAPGVASSSGSNTSRSIAGLRNPSNDSGIVFNGMRGRNNSISIDGMDNRDETTGGNRVALGL